MNRAERRAAGAHRRRAPVAGALGSLNGVPVVDGSAVFALPMDVGHGPDARVMVGIGPEGREPIAYLVLCPCEGVDGLVDDLIEAATIARPQHPAH